MQNFRSKLSSATPTHLTYQVVNAKQQCFNTAITLPIPAGSETQINPDQLWQKLQRESLESNFRTPIKFKELVANRLHELWEGKKLITYWQASLKRESETTNLEAIPYSHCSQ